VRRDGSYVGTHGTNPAVRKLSYQRAGRERRGSPGFTFAPPGPQR